MYRPSKEDDGDNEINGGGSSLHQQLGMSHICTEEDAKRTTLELIRKLLDSDILIPFDTIKAGAKIGRNKLVRLAGTHFGDMNTTTLTSTIAEE